MKNTKVISTMAMVTGLVIGFAIMLIYAVAIGFVGGMIGIEHNILTATGQAFGTIWQAVTVIFAIGLYNIWK